MTLESMILTVLVSMESVDGQLLKDSKSDLSVTLSSQF